MDTSANLLMELKSSSAILMKTPIKRNLAYLSGGKVNAPMVSAAIFLILIANKKSKKVKIFSS